MITDDATGNADQAVPNDENLLSAVTVNTDPEEAYVEPKLGPSVDPLALARHFIKHGVPVFIAARRSDAEIEAGKSEFAFPKNWQNTVPDERNLRGWTPSHAVCAVTGVHFDVIDVDPRNGGDESMVNIIAAGLLPPVYGEIHTPSGGYHCYVSRTGRAKGTPATGVDLQAGDGAGGGRGFVYIPPTRRPSKLTGEWRTYEVEQPIELGRLKGGVNDPRAEPFLKFLHVKMPPKQDSSATSTPWQARQHTDREQRYLQAAFAALVERVEAAPEGTRNDELNKCAYRTGQLIAGCGLPEVQCKQHLIKAALQAGLTQSQAVYTVSRSILQGKKRPIAPGPFAPPEVQQKAAIEYARQANAELEAYLAGYDEMCKQVQDAK